ncbi:hypothetical protein SAMN05443144_1135 [Fodinibius roseus]|uniref:Uncharacterized protein n=1 Tax=Fodinibius roseus TaxID=1194090 RepID=A0A1M5EB29_9BACT|nr:hypothetical protein SAMN05443144_1135 [Fodinibius roseus]
MNYHVIIIGISNKTCHASHCEAHPGGFFFFVGYAIY